MYTYDQALIHGQHIKWALHQPSKGQPNTIHRLTSHTFNSTKLRNPFIWPLYCTQPSFKIIDHNVLAG